MANLHAIIEDQRYSLTRMTRMYERLERKPRSELTVGYTKSLMDEIETMCETFKSVHNDILAMVRSNSTERQDVPYCVDDIYGDFTDLFLTFKAKLLDINAELTTPTAPPLSSTRFIHSANDSISASVRLPKIDLPTFTGEYLEWISYSDMFLTLVHNNPALTDVQKYFYLKSSCTGTPLEIVQEFPATGYSYELAWTALLNRFHNKRKLVEQILKRLFAIPNTSDSFESIKTLLDTTRNCLAMLRTQNINTSTWDAILVYITIQKLDNQTRKEWEQSLDDTSEIPDMKKLLEFLDKTFRTLESVADHDNTKQPKDLIKNHKKPKPRGLVNSHTAAASSDNCPCCQKRHYLYKCFKYAAFSNVEKREFVLKNKLCINCLNVGHVASDCTLKTRCQVCSGLHHTTLHTSFVTPEHKQNTQSSFNNVVSNGSLSANSSAVLHELNNTQVLLATVTVFIKTSKGTFNFIALVDQGSQASFISKQVADQLQLPRQSTTINISGIGTSNAIVRSYCTFKLWSSHHEAFSLECNALILRSLSSYQPPLFSSTALPNLSNIRLSNPKYMNRGRIDLVLGADVYGKLLLPGMQTFDNGMLLQETYFGWMISGPTGQHPTANHSDFSELIVNHITLEEQLRLFWEQEELLTTKMLNPEENECEKLFASTHTRDKTGRYCVKLPFKCLLFKGETPNFSQTDYNALKRLKQLESSFQTRPEFADLYRNFMREYEQLNHMERIGSYPADLPRNCYILPHHGVLKENSTTTKLRVVFDGNNRRLPQSSLNDELAAGPALQTDLPAILTRWRRFAVCFTADLEKMFRQINVCDEHQLYQCILWREHPNLDIGIYKLRTVTYGSTSAPYLAIRVLHQLAVDEKDKFPEACQILRSDTYVDDVLSGADSVNEAILLHQQLSALLQSGGFNLRKWSTNSIALLQSIPEENRASNDAKQLQTENFVNALGLSWDTVCDSFRFKLNIKFSETITKRSLLSEACKLFDPLGWLSPITITAKIIFQKLWLIGIEWSDSLPEEIHDEWLNYRSSLKAIEQLRIPRWIGLTRQHTCELHCFSDASQVAFAATVYARVSHADGRVQVSLLQSKTKVAPLKTVTIPKLELCAAVLLARLAAKVKSELHTELRCCVYWTDSTTVLGWIRKQPSTLNVYVANRVATIQTYTNVNDWRYVSTSDNPADCASRGMTPEKLQGHNLWWHGPSFLLKSAREWPRSPYNFDTNLEVREQKVCTHLIERTDISIYPEITKRYSSLSKLIRVTAYLLRAAHNMQSKKNNYDREIDFLKTYELKLAELTLIQITQAVTFSTEIKCLKSDSPLPHNSRIRSLSPFLDEYDVLRVGGRIRNANMEFETKHPILLTKNNPISFLIFTDAHMKTLHGGLQLMHSYVMRKHWVLSSRNLAKSVLKQCIICHRYNAKTEEQLMGNLPACRVTPTPPFYHSGLDYAGPITIKQSTQRNASTTKGYICLFVCMCTKALHLEAVISLTTESFLSAFRRFISRRGSCAHLYSDCGTTFVGANKELQILRNRSLNSLPKYLVEALANDGTTWHFIPPATPHFGGLWEAGVKSTKHHLRRVLRDRKLTYEELSTLLAQIESCLNARPLCPQSTDPTDTIALTPAILLGVEKPDCLLADNLLDTNFDHLSRWKKVEQLKQHFWQRWLREYVCRLQARPKWTSQRSNVNVGELVLLYHENTPPGKWPLARISEVHPGTDGVVRVVTVCANGNYYKRPVTKICLLPISKNPLFHQ